MEDYRKPLRSTPFHHHTTHQDPKEPKKNKLLKAIQSIYNTIKSWFSSSDMPTSIETLVENFTSDNNDETKEIANILEGIAKKDQTKLTEINMSYNETDKTVSIKFGDSLPIIFPTMHDKENKYFQSGYDEINAKMTTEDLKKCIFKDSNRKPGVKIYSENCFIDFNEIFNANYEHDSEELRQAMKDKTNQAIEVINNQIPDYNSSNSALLALSSQAGLAIFSQISLAKSGQIGKNPYESKYAAKDSDKKINIYMISQGTCFVDITYQVRYLSTDKYEDGPVGYTSDRFQLLVEPDCFNLIGSQHVKELPDDF